MKIIHMIKQSAAALFLAAISFAGCKKNNGDDESAKPIMTMTTTQKGKVEIRLAGTGTAVINWGDGTATDTVTPPTGRPRVYTHTFSDATSRTIVIDGQNITTLYCAAMQLTTLDVTNNIAPDDLSCHANELTAVDVSKNTALTYLDVSFNKLTALDVSKNAALTTLWVQSNKFDVAGLNALFGTLHDKGGTIDVRSNHGFADCDKSIAADKGWRVIED